METISWPGAIERNRAALLRIVAVLFVYAGLDEGGAETVPRHVWRKILRLLRPAESAVRRLIVIAARGIEVKPPKPRPEKPPTGIERLQAAGLLVIREGVNLGLARAWSEAAAGPAKTAKSRIPVFPLIDPPRRFDARSWNGARPFPQAGFSLAPADEPVDASHLCRRLLALKNALDDLPAHANRLARRNARRALPLPSSSGLTRGPNRSPRLNPLRRGWPPGRRKRSLHEVDDVLAECHSLALHAQREDTS